MATNPTAILSTYSGGIQSRNHRATFSEIRNDQDHLTILMTPWYLIGVPLLVPPAVIAIRQATAFRPQRNLVSNRRTKTSGCCRYGSESNAIPPWIRVFNRNRFDRWYRTRRVNLSTWTVSRKPCVCWWRGVYNGFQLKSDLDSLTPPSASWKSLMLPTWRLRSWVRLPFEIDGNSLANSDNVFEPDWLNLAISAVICFGTVGSLVLLEPLPSLTKLSGLSVVVLQVER